jgi:hypothetical protein
MDSALPAPAELSPARRIVAAYVSPSALFEDIRRNASWWPAFLLLVIGSVIFCFAVQKQVGWPRTYEAILRQTPKQEARMAQMQPAQAANAKAIAAKITAASAWGSPVIILVATAVSAAVLLGTLNFGFGGKARYGEIFSVYLYASLPLVIHSLLAVVALFAGLDTGSFLITNPVGSNLGYYLPPETSKWMLAIATSFDLFTLWMLVLLALGCFIVARVSRAAAATSVFGWWILLLIVKVGSAAFQG